VVLTGVRGAARREKRDGQSARGALSLEVARAPRTESTQHMRRLAFENKFLLVVDHLCRSLHYFLLPLIASWHRVRALSRRRALKIRRARFNRAECNFLIHVQKDAACEKER